MAKKTTTKKATPKKAAPKKATPKKAAAKKAAPKKAAPKKASPKKAAPKKAAPKKAAPKKAALKKASPKKASPKKAAPKKAAPKKAAPKKAAPKKAAPKKAAPKKASPKKAAPKKASPKKASPKKASPKKASPKKASPKKASPKKASPKKASPKKASPKKAATGAPAIDGTPLDAWLAYVETSPTSLAELEAAIGHTLPDETRRFLAAGPSLPDPDAEDHPEIHGIPFAAGLPDVDAFLEGLKKPLLGRYLCTVHFLGLYPFAVRLDRGDYMYALAALDSHAPGVGGVLYYDEREVGTWGASVSEFLATAVSDCWKQIDEQRDGLDEEELDEFEPDLDDVRDCFRLPRVAALSAAPEAASRPEALAKSWDPFWRRYLALSSTRWWMPAFLRGRLEPYDVRELPTPETWEAERAQVGKRYGDTIYWLLAHALLGNRAELDDARTRAASLPGSFVRAVADAAPGLIDRFGPLRKKLYALAAKRS
ncbi:MAG: hypothetical protein R3B99_17305 [Polyangiales bacterium]